MDHLCQIYSLKKDKDKIFLKGIQFLKYLLDFDCIQHGNFYNDFLNEFSII